MRGNHIKKFLWFALVFLGLQGSALVFCETTDDAAVFEAKKENARVLSLDQVSRLALQNNFDIQLAKYDAWIARTDKGKAESIYDTILNAQITYRDNQSKSNSSLAGLKTLDTDYNVGLTKKLPTGTTIGADLTNNRNWTDSSFVTINPSHDSALSVSVEQQLGKNFFGLQDRGDIKITKLDIEKAEFTSLDKIEGDLANVQKAYWDLVLQNEKVAIEEEMVTHAKRLFDLNQEKIQNGLVERPELLASEANYKQRVNAFLLAQDTLKTKQNVLQLLLNITQHPALIAPGDALSVCGETQEMNSALAAAFENRYDYKKARRDIDAKNIKLSMKKNDIWPEVNLMASLARNGIDTSFEKAIEQIGDEDNPNFSVGVTFSLPLENTSARANLKEAQWQKARALVSLKQLERKIAVNIMDQVRHCNVLKELAVNAVSIAELQVEKLKEEEKRFMTGRSDTDTLIRFQEDVTRARDAAAQAKFNYQAARVDLKKTQSSLLRTYWEGEL